MKRLLIFALSLVTLCLTVEARSYRIEDVPNVQLADRTRFVSNPDAILSAEAVRAIDEVCFSLKERGIAEVAVVALKEIEPADSFDFAVSLFESWGVGDDKLDNGLGILLVEDLREVRFVTGYGLEGVLPDALCYRLQQQYMIPYFRAGDYSQGMVEGVVAIDKLLSGEDLPIAEGDDEAEAMAVALVFTLLCVVLPIVMIIAAERQKSKCPKCGKHTLRVVDSNDMVDTNGLIIKVETLRCTNCGAEQTRTKRNDHNRRGGGGVIFFPMGGFGGTRGGGFGGGFGGGGFGGGSFGGGGSSSSW
ncbi:MAG: TPM domain-containing protein [Alistipes sp.]|nr:TPM domain-containing protein [Alistipes sp.]